MCMDQSLCDVTFLVWIVKNLYSKNQPRNTQNLTLWWDKKFCPSTVYVFNALHVKTHSYRKEGASYKLSKNVQISVKHNI